MIVVLCALWAWPAAGQDAAPAPRANGELLFRATFQKGLEGFEPAYDSEWMQARAHDGVAEISALAPDTSVAALQPTVTFKDFVAEVDIRPLTQRTGEDFGLYVRSDSLENDLSFYYSVSFVPAEEMAYFNIWQDATEWVTLTETPIPAGVLDPEGFNRLRLEAVGDEFTVFLNDIFLFRTKDETLSEPGIIGLFVSAAEDMPEGETAGGQFDDLNVYAVGSSKTSRQTKPTVSAPPSRAGEGTPTLNLTDDFSDPDSGWWVGDADDGSVRYVDGELLVRSYTDATYRMGSTPGLVAADVVIEVQGRLADGTANNWQTVFCRSRDESDYAFAYSADGYYSANIWVDGERMREQEPTASDAVRQGKDAVNDVKVACVGSRLQFWINGALLVDWEDDRLTEGEFGVAVTSLEGDFSEVAFDNFVATGTLAPEGAAEAEPESAAPTAEAAATVTAPSLNVRAGPGAGYARVDSVAQGEILAVIGRNSACSWVQVTTPRAVGWVSAGYVRLSDPCDGIPLVGQEEAPIVAEPPAGGVVVTVEPGAAAGTNLVTDFESFGDWRRGDETWGSFTQSGEEAYSGRSSGKIAYDFPAKVPGDRNYVVFLRSLPIPGRPDALKLQVYGDGSGSFLNVWVKDATGQVWQFTFGQIKHMGWKPLVAALDTGGKWPVQNISGDGKPLQYPLQLQALVLDYPTSDAASGVVFVDDLQTVTQ